MGSHGHGRRPFCPSCSKPSRLCLCNRFKNPPIDNSVAITILQHSHEKSHALNSTRIALLGLKNIAVAPVSDVHFQAQFVIRSMRSDSNCSSRSGAGRIMDLVNTQMGGTRAESGTGKVDFDSEKRNLNEIFDLKSGSGTSVVESGLVHQGHGSNAENVSSDWIVDSLKTQKGIKELGSESSGVVSDLENRSSGELPENDGFKWVSDSSETQKVVGVSTAVFAGEFCKSWQSDHGSDEGKPNNNCSCFDANSGLGSDWKDHVNPDFDEVPGSKTENGFLVAVLENGNFDKNLMSFQTHECKQDFEKIPVPPTRKKDIDLQSSKKQLNKLVSEGNHDSLEEGKMVPELDPLSGMVAAIQIGSLMNGPTHENGSQKHSQKLDFDRMPVPLPSNNLVSVTASQSVIACMCEQNSGSLEFDQLGAVVTATIDGRGFTSGNPFPEFDKLSASPLGKDFISNGFIVKKLQRKQLGDSVEVEEFEITIPPGSALLFPSKKAISLEAVDFEVKHLIVLDGTWAKARRMYYENPWLKLLPHLKLDPREMSLYSEVRHQPKAGCLSTIESIVCALKALGEDSVGLDDLLDVFESMVGDQRRCKLERLSKESSA